VNSLSGHNTENGLCPFLFSGKVISGLQNSDLIPRYQDDLAYFLGDLRSCAYSSQSKIARILGLSHTTISRYENGHLRPPIGYLAHLASRLVDQIDPGDKDIQQKKERILDEANQAIRWCFPDEVPFEKWEELQDMADSYLESRQLPEETQISPRDKYNWRVTPEIENFCGRVEDLKQLEDLVNLPQTNLILVQGMGGIGKTSLATKLAERLESNFEYVIWITLYNSPSISDLITSISSFLPPPLITNPTRPLEQQIQKLMTFFKKHHCLLVFDNLESVMRGGENIGRFRQGFEGYSTFLKNFASTSHQSCLVITSREKPAMLNEWKKPSKNVHIFNLKGLKAAEADKLLQPWGFATDQELVETLNQSLSGNPLALIMAAEVIETFYGKDVARFLQSENLIVGDVRNFLNKSFNRCSHLSKTILYWLSVLREPASLQRLEKLLIPRPLRSDIVEALHSLIRSSLVDNRAGKFSLQSFIAEYINDRLVRESFNEIIEGGSKALHQVALLTTDSSYQVQQAQRQNLIQPITNLLVNSLDLQHATEKLASLLNETRGSDHNSQGYGAGNLINIMLHMNQELPNRDFSNLTIRHADLRGHTLHETDLSNASLHKCVFDNSFSGVNAVALSPSAKYLAVAVEQDIRIWNLAEKQPYRLLGGHSDLVWNLSFGTEDHILFSQGADNFVHRWNIDSGEIELSVQDPEAPISALEINQDTTFIATGNRAGEIVLWHAQNGQKLLSLHANPMMIRSLALDSTEKNLLAGYQDGTVSLWNIPVDEFYTLSDIHQGPVTAVTFIGDGETFATGGTDGIISIRTTVNGDLIYKLTGHQQGITVLRCCPRENILVSGSLDKTASTWDLETGERRLILEGHSRSVRSLDMNKEGEILATGSYDRTIRLWDLQHCQLVDVIEGLTFDIRALEFSPDGQTIASGGSDYQVRLWDLSDKQGMRTEKGHDRWVSSVTFSPDGTKLASGSYDRTVRIWNVETGAEVMCLYDYPHWVYCLAFSQDGKILAAGGEDGTIRLWDSANFKAGDLLTGQSDGINCLVFSADGQYLASGGKDQSICIWKLIGSNLEKEFKSLGSPVMRLGFEPDPSCLVFLTEDCWIKKIDIRSGKVIQSEQIASGLIKSAALSLNNDLLAFCADQEQKRVVLWDIEKRAILSREQVSNSAITSMAFRGDSRLLAVGNLQGEIISWDINNQEKQTSMMVRKPYDGLKISGISGLSFEQIETLKALGAIE
jgi:WD40 repeat protein/transcriptional regulator with XRE-family HTH domain